MRGILAIALLTLGGCGQEQAQTNVSEAVIATQANQLEASANAAVASKTAAINAAAEAELRNLSAPGNNATVAQRP